MQIRLTQSMRTDFKAGRSALNQKAWDFLVSRMDTDYFGFFGLMGRLPLGISWWRVRVRYWTTILSPLVSGIFLIYWQAVKDLLRRRRTLEYD